MRSPNPLAKKLRRNMPEAERRLWVRLKNKQLGGRRFRRQHTIGPYIADFVCLDAMVVVELDGDQHGRGAAPMRDLARDALIESAGFIVLRFWNHEVATNIDGVMQTIFHVAMERVRGREAGVL
jgi:very-short-patch-repair endonuclease